MWQFLLRQFLQAAQLAARQPPGGIIFSTPTNGPEAYADRIKRDFHLHDYADAWSRYASNPAYWERWYAPPPADRFDNPRSPILPERQKYRSSVPEVPSLPPSVETALLPSAPPYPIAPDGRDLDFDVSGLPSWMRNALAYQPQSGPAVIASVGENAAPEDSRNVRILGARLARY